MASDETIRAALREATRAMNGRMADRGYEVPWSEDGATITAAAVAEFLRALPGPGYVGTPPRTAWITPLHMQNLADEVARAAEGDG